MRSDRKENVIILLADDDPGDQELTRRALASEELNVDLHIVDDGEEALDFLLRRGRFEDPTASPRPDLILLDMNMPKKNGREVLAELKSDESLARIPVVVLTTSQHKTDIASSYDLGCNSYIQKPMDIDQFLEVVRRFGEYWFNVVTLPPVAAK